MPRTATSSCCAGWPRAQAALVARWLLAGFVHGVMNTDNTTISGETIDYGPCAFMDAYDPATVFSSIDHGGRYAYGNQPAIMQWNLARLAETLLPLIDDDSDAAVEAATDVLSGFADAYQRHWDEGMAAKLGLAAPDQELVTDLLDLLHAQRVDYTGFFRALSAGTARALFAQPGPFDAWAARRTALLPARPGSGGRRDGPGQPALHPAQPPRRGGARPGGTGRHGAVPPPPRRGLPALRSTARPGALRRPRRPRAAPRTSPTAAPEQCPGDAASRRDRPRCGVAGLIRGGWDRGTGCCGPGAGSPPAGMCGGCAGDARGAAHRNNSIRSSTHPTT